MVLDFEYVKVCTLEALPAEGHGAVLTKDRQDEDRLRQLDDRFAVQEVWKEILPNAPLLISSAICGGELRTRFEKASKERSCCLLLEPIRMRFPLPCPDGCGEAIGTIPTEHAFYSEALCCYYAHTPQAIFLWDTEETLEEKVRLAKAAGFYGVAYK